MYNALLEIQNKLLTSSPSGSYWESVEILKNAFSLLLVPWVVRVNCPSAELIEILSLSIVIIGLGYIEYPSSSFGSISK
jgi:hypothetical protein